MTHKSQELRLGSGIVQLIGGALLIAVGLVLFLITENVLFKGLNILFLVVFELTGAALIIVGAIIAKCRIRSLKAIADCGGIEAAAEDYASSLAVRLDKDGHEVLGQKFVFSLESGNIFTYDELFWAYISVNRKDSVSVAQGLTLRTKDGRSMRIARETPDKEGSQRLTMYLELIKARSPGCLIGYSKENYSLWKNAIRINRSDK